MNTEVLGRHDYGWSGHSCNSTVLQEKKKKPYGKISMEQLK